MLIKGHWAADWHPVHGSDREGRFLRQPSQIRHWITTDGAAGPTGSGGFPAERGRYHLYVALLCPWAGRTLIARSLLQLEESISISVVSPLLTEEGWRFGGFAGASKDHLYHSQYLHQLYTRHDPQFTGRATVPVLWDKQRGQMVNNESADILRMLNQAFPRPEGLDLYPEPLRPAIDRLNDEIYADLNNGVYRAGFAGSQQAYQEACAAVFAALDQLEQRLATGGPYLFGDQLTETDIRLFVTLARFDLAYHGLFKCNLRRLLDYPQLSRYLSRLCTIPAFRDSVHVAHIKQGYYSIRTLNPSGIVPLGPTLDWYAVAS